MEIYIRNDHWSSTEDHIVRAAVMKYGTNQWSRVASLLSRKSAAQCRARWREVLDPYIKSSQWSSDEDAKLMRLVAGMPNMWRSIGASLGGRTPAQSFERWKYLTENTETAGKRKHSVLPKVDELSDQSDSEGDLGSDAEKQLMAEAQARLTNSMGRKAKRKQRERLEAEEKFLDSVEEHRRTGAAIRVPKVSTPTVALAHIRELQAPARINAVTQKKGFIDVNQGEQRKAGRPKLKLPVPKSSGAKAEHALTAASEAEQKRVRLKLQRIPIPTNLKTLVELASVKNQDDAILAREDEPKVEKPARGSGVQAQADAESAAGTRSYADSLLKIKPSDPISMEAQALLAAELGETDEPADANDLKGIIAVPLQRLSVKESLTAAHARQSALLEKLHSLYQCH